MKKLFVIFFLFSAIAIGGYFFYTKIYKAEVADVWSLVPENATLVYETSNVVRNWNNLQKRALWKNLQRIPFYKSLKDNFESLDSLGDRSGQLDELLTGNPLLISLHVTSRDDFNYLFFVELPTLKGQSLARKIADHFKKQTGFSHIQRNYNDFSIQEVTHNASGETFSYIFYKNYFIGSFAPFLVEDVVRIIKGEVDKTFSTENKNLFDVTKLENDDGNLYINSRKVQQLIGIFGKEGKSDLNNQLRNFCQSTFLDLTLTNEDILLNGFSFNNAGNGFLNTFRSQKAGKLEMTNVLPNRTASLFHLTFENGDRWKTNLLTYWNTNLPEQKKKWDQLNVQDKITPDDFFKWFGGEIGLANLEPIDPLEPEKLLVVKPNDLNEALNHLNRQSETLHATNGDSIYHEVYANIPLRQLTVEELPGKLLGPAFKGFTQTFYAPIDGYIVMANDVEVIKSLINDRESEDVWGKSVKQNEFLESTLKDSNLSLIVNTANIWGSLVNDLSPKWKNFAQLFELPLKRFEMIAIQFSSVEKNFFTSMLVRYKEIKQIEQFSTNYLLVQNAFTEFPIGTKPYIVRNPTNGSREILLQDVSDQLYLIDSQGKLIWKDSLNGQIKDGIKQIDFHGNGGKQYFFITDRHLHIMDRNGGYVEGFPVEVSSEAHLEKSNVIDYDKSKRYRFLVSDRMGNIFMYDKNGTNLDGWNPRKVNKKLSSSPFHIRVRGKDCIVTIQEDGVVNIMNRRGKMYPGFPLDLKEQVHNSMFVNVGTTFSRTAFTTLTDNGQLIQFNLEGAVLKREQLYRPSKATLFKLAIDALGRTFIIARQEQNRLSILDKNGKVIFEKDYVLTGDLDIQFYNFGRGVQIFAITDKEQEFTYLYDATGNLINYQPIESAHRIGLMYFESQNKYHVYKNYENQFSILEYKR
ncbi:hypothetical protein QQ008_06030 [Fulvivirgaceae bacterium BMA10]|uniref:DUF3352 domain-containing protein n=1 Tax=Splendidivirga corallicola TaxID=3051826 RepID=A0ABT8KJM0_9BACT|nr:hypothetical protein [Fulvivirgaceae bacterium BMA10]